MMIKILKHAIILLTFLPNELFFFQRFLSINCQCGFDVVLGIQELNNLVEHKSVGKSETVHKNPTTRIE